MIEAFHLIDGSTIFSVSICLQWRHGNMHFSWWQKHSFWSMETPFFQSPFICNGIMVTCFWTKKALILINGNIIFVPLETYCSHHGTFNNISTTNKYIYLYTLVFFLRVYSLVFLIYQYKFWCNQNKKSV
jgi:hypothetical protein